jgi:hypothetical protein
MATILDELLKDIKEPDVDTQVKKICDTIYEEEVAAKRITNPEYEPKGSNIFLVLEVNPLNSKVNLKTFLSLERESYGKYILGVWQASGLERYAQISESDKYNLMRRIKVIDVNESDTKRIIKRFAEQYKVMKGN